MSTNTSPLVVDGATYDIFPIDQVKGADTLPYSLQILLENLLRHEDGVNVTREMIDALGAWDPLAEPDAEIPFAPARVLLQDFTGVPCVVDLASMREAVVHLGGRPEQVNPLVPVELVIDHSVVVDDFGSNASFSRNVEFEYQRNEERYRFLRWGQRAFQRLRVVPPDTGIVHQVNLEYLARGVMVEIKADRTLAFLDSCVGTDSHTTMINGLGVLGWGVGGIEAEAAMLGQAVSMLVPQVVGFRLLGAARPGVTATDLVLTITELLRKHGVVGKFVEFFGEGVSALPLETRATIGNMSPEFGCTVALFPVDEVTLGYLRTTGRKDADVRRVEAYMKRQGLWFDPHRTIRFSETVELDLATVEPSIAGPKRPQDRIALRSAKQAFQKVRSTLPAPRETEPASSQGLEHGSVVIAAITSCTNTSNPEVLVAAGLLAKAAHERGLERKPWVKTSLAPGSRVVMDYLGGSGLLPHLEALGFFLVGFGCATCIGNSGPLPESVRDEVLARGLSVAAVLSGNRNFEGRINQDVKLNYLASPPLVVAYALAGTMDIDFDRDPIGTGKDGQPVYLRDIWPAPTLVSQTVRASVSAAAFVDVYKGVFEGDLRWQNLPTPEGQTFAWEAASTYVRPSPFVESMQAAPEPIAAVTGARALLVLGDSITTDHISPAGNIEKDGPAARYLEGQGVLRRDFNSYGSRRGNHEVMVRGTFANVRLRNQLAGGKEGGYTKNLLTGAIESIYDASLAYRAAGVPLVVLAGKEYGSGSSRDWAAKGTLLLGVRAVIAESFERIHRSNLVGMGVLPLEFPRGASAASLGLDGTETFELVGFEALGSEKAGRSMLVQAKKADGAIVAFDAHVRIDTPAEAMYFRHRGILPYVLRKLAGVA